MSGRYLTDLANVCRSAGLTVVEYPGWQTRGRGSGGYSSGRPTHVMVHHTASPASWDGQRDADYIAVQDSDAPLSNLYLPRDGIVWTIAAGCTNTNGKGCDTWGGGVPENSMNSYAIGIEAGNNGTGEPWPEVQQNAYLVLVRALMTAYGITLGRVRAHREWTPGRKIDPAGQSRWANGSAMWDMDAFRGSVAASSGPSPTPTPPTPPPNTEEDDMSLVIVTPEGANARFIGHKVTQTTTAPDGSTAPRTFILWCEWVDGNDAAQLNRLNAYTNMGVPEYRCGLGDLVGMGLLGPVPTGDALKTWTRADFGNVMA